MNPLKNLHETSHFLTPLLIEVYFSSSTNLWRNISKHFYIILLCKTKNFFSKYLYFKHMFYCITWPSVPILET